jgi:hypothetical protein
MNLTKGETKLLQEDNEYYHVMLDVADLMTNYTPIDDPKESAARAIQFVLSHQEREHDNIRETIDNFLAAEQAVQQLREKLISYRSKVADLVQDSHNRGITTAQLIELDQDALTSVAEMLLATNIAGWKEVSIDDEDEGINPVAQYEHNCAKLLECLVDELRGK